jgi:hypothetical protein
MEFIAVARLANGAEAEPKPGTNLQEFSKAAVPADEAITPFELLERSSNEILIDRTAGA